jgi:hypothetical protein
MTSLPIMSGSLFSAALAMALPVPSCHASKTITVMLCGGAESVALVLPVDGAPAVPLGPEFAKACHACRHEDEAPQPA